MVYDQNNAPTEPDEFMVRRLMKETGIAEGQARELIVLLGLYNWASLL